MFVTYVLSSASFGLDFVGDGLRPCNSSISCSAGVVIFLGGLAHLPSQQFTESLVFAMHSALPSNVRPRCSVASVQGTWSHWCAALFTFRILATSASLKACHPRLSIAGSAKRPRPAWTVTGAMGSQPWPTTCVVSLLMSFPTTSSPQERTLFALSSLPGVASVWGLARWHHDHSSTGRPLATGMGLPPALSSTMLTVPDPIVRADSPGPHSFLWAHLRSAPTAFQVM